METNYDPDETPPANDDRRDKAIVAMNKVGKANMDVTQMFKVSFVLIIASYTFSRQYGRENKGAVFFGNSDHMIWVRPSPWPRCFLFLMDKSLYDDYFHLVVSKSRENGKKLKRKQKNFKTVQLQNGC